jgi:Flp pilus assembly pilin Flp
MQVFRRLWSDEAGFIISTELVLVATILVIGMIVGLTALRNQVVVELTDLGQAIGSVNPTYAYDSIVAYAIVSGSSTMVAYVDGSYYTDTDLVNGGTAGAAGVTVSFTDALYPTGSFTPGSIPGL